MAYKKLNILKHPTKLFLVAGLALAGLILIYTPTAKAACAAPSTDYGTVTSNVTAPTTGTYRIWSRIMSGTASTDNSYSLEIDGGTCIVVGNSNSMATGSWVWVDYKDGTTGSKIDVNLSAGNHSFKMIGTEEGVKLDRVIITTDTTCVPTGTGDNCVTVADTTDPVTSISAPAANAKLRGTVNVTANASDVGGTVERVELYVDGVMVGSADTTSPYSFSWNTTTASNGNRSLTVKAYDDSGNEGTSSARTVMVDNSAPTVSLAMSPSSTTVAGTVTLTASATDNDAVSNVEFYRGATLMSSDSSSPYNYSWNSTTVTNGSYALTARAYDAAGNVTTSTTINVTVNNTTTPPPDTTPPTVSFSSPASGATVSGSAVTVGVNASDAGGMDSVELYINNTLYRTDVASPYSFSWDTTGYANGSYTLKVTAYDEAGNQTSVTRTVSVSNATPTPKQGDVNNNGTVDYNDALVVALNWGLTGRSRSQGDLTGDGKVDYNDALQIALGWGK